MSYNDDSGARGLLGGRSAGATGFAAQVISTLKDRQAVTRTGLRQIVVDALMRDTLAPGAFDPALVLDALRGHRLRADALVDHYVPEAAAQLGEMWLDDEISFATVTIGALRLQSLVRQAMQWDAAFDATGRSGARVLLIVPQGEQHFLGVTVLGAQLFRMGCEVETACDASPDEVARRVRHDPPDIVMISCSRPGALERVRQTVLSVRTATPIMPAIAMGGAIRGDADDLRKRTGVDIVTNSAEKALALCVRDKKVLARR